MRYEFRLAGLVPEALAEAFPELHADQSVFCGTVTNEAHLYRLLTRFQSLGLDVLDMRQLHNPAPATIPRG